MFDHLKCFLEQVYWATVEPIIPLIFERTKATCFAYGQTGRCCIRSLHIIHYIMISLSLLKFRSFHLHVFGSHQNALNNKL